MAHWEGSGVDALKNAIDSIFKEDGKIPMAEEDYVTRLVSSTADGANVNMGELSGLLTRSQLANESPLCKSQGGACRQT